MSLEVTVLLAMMLERYYYIAQFDKVWDSLRRTFLSLGALSKQYSQLGESSADVIALLLSGPRPLQKLDGVTFEPGGPAVVARADGVLLLNTWVDPKVGRRQGDAQRFVDHLMFIMDGNVQAVDHMLNWLAFTLQNPGKKLASAVLIIGGQGVGKSLIGEFHATLVGRDNTAFMDAGMLGSAFNGQLMSCNLVVVNEYNASIGRSGYAVMKHLITGETIFINQKGVAVFQIQNRCNFLLFSNDLDAAKLDSDDRRYFVWHSHAVKRPQEYYAELCEWFYGEGKHHVLDFLLSRDLSNFNPYAAPPQTAARAALIRESMNDQVQALYDAMEMGAAPFDGELVVISDAVEYLNGLKGPRFTVRHLSTFLRAQGAEEIGQRRIADRDGSFRKPRVWALENVDRWRNSSESEIAAAYVKPGTPQPRARTTAQSESSPADQSERELLELSAPGSAGHAAASVSAADTRSEEPATSWPEPEPAEKANLAWLSPVAAAEEVELEEPSALVGEPAAAPQADAEVQREDAELNDLLDEMPTPQL